jgi:hypothetical protein
MSSNYGYVALVSICVSCISPTCGSEGLMAALPYLAAESATDEGSLTAREAEARL